MQAAYLEQLKENFKTVGLGVLGVNMNGPKIINQVRPWINKRKISLSIKLLEELQNKEAVSKFSSPLSGKNLPFSSLSDKLSKKKEK